MRTLFLLSSFSCARGYPCNVRKLGLGRFYLNLLKDQDTYRGLNEWALCVIKPSSGTSAVTYCMCTTPLEAQACVSSAVGPCHDVDIGRFAKKSPFSNVALFRGSVLLAKEKQCTIAITSYLGVRRLLDRREFLHYPRLGRVPPLTTTRRVS